ncbi:hypothetical protein [Bradyrhizobium sp.]|jgi:hypothetical protein|uniref:hypothetical protein n=1 Tax=Bradyrhizobium sp. TaxID=376 RepID=UPI003C70B786
MPKSLTEIRSLARSHTRTAINVLVGIMRSKDATAAARVSAANAILDRGWGKVTQGIEIGDDGALELIHRIELRADFQHLRRWRKSVEQAQSYTFKAVITIIVTGFVGAVWLGIKVMLEK